MVDADEGAHDVRHDEADEGDGAGERRRRGREEHGARRGQAPVDDDVLAEAAGQVVAERDGVERGPGRQREQEAEAEEGRDVEHLARVAARHGPDLPEAEAVEGAAVGDEHRPDEALRQAP